MAETTFEKCPAFQICERLGNIHAACLGIPYPKDKKNMSEKDYLENILDMNEQIHACLRSIVMLSSSDISEKS